MHTHPLSKAQRGSVVAVGTVVEYKDVHALNTSTFSCQNEVSSAFGGIMVNEEKKRIPHAFWLSSRPLKPLKWIELKDQKTLSAGTVCVSESITSTHPFCIACVQLPVTFHLSSMTVWLGLFLSHLYLSVTSCSFFALFHPRLHFFFLPTIWLNGSPPM